MRNLGNIVNEIILLANQLTKVKQMEKVGTHLIVDAWQAPPELLNNPEAIRRGLIEAITAGKATLIDLCVHQFSPHGVTATATLAESHIAIHTWPEHGYFAADLFFCGAGEPQIAMQILQSALQAKQIRVRELDRGFKVESLKSAFSLEY